MRPQPTANLRARHRYTILMRIFLIFLLALPTTVAVSAEPATIRIATYNVSLFRESEGQLRADLADPTMRQARLAAAVLQQVRPDIVLLNEFDWDAGGEAVQLFRQNFLSVGQDGRQALDFPYVYVPETNTGVASGFDLDRDGTVTTVPGSRAYGGDAFGFGEFPGQYGFVILSRFPIDVEGTRSFRLMRWKDVPGASMPADWYSVEAAEALRLSSKNHVDVPVRIGSRTIHVLASHPTPPTFDGPEDRNGARNADEIRFWSLYVGGGDSPWLVDDQGRRGPLGEASFVILGDLNSDPQDGDSRHEAIRGLLGDPRVRGAPAPRSAGAAEQAQVQGGINLTHEGDPSSDTADFDDRQVGNLRLDYVLPSIDLEVSASGVFWPESSHPDFALVGTYPFPVSDHRLVWADVVLASGKEEKTR